jgi:DNA-directed RNA polymerase specialized sigma24 family protein
MGDFTDAEFVLARKVASKFPWWWRDDAYNLALEAIWRLRDDYDYSCPRGAWTYRVAYRFCRDEMRAEWGRPGFSRHKALRTAVTLDWTHQGVNRETPEHVVVDMNTNLCHMAEGWSEIDITIVQQLCAGRLKQDIARDLGVTPGRVSQMLHSVKDSIRNCVRAA